MAHGPVRRNAPFVPVCASGSGMIIPCRLPLAVLSVPIMFPVRWVTDPLSGAGAGEVGRKSCGQTSNSAEGVKEIDVRPSGASEARLMLYIKAIKESLRHDQETLDCVAPPSRRCCWSNMPSTLQLMEGCCSRCCYGCLFTPDAPPFAPKPLHSSQQTS